MLKHHWSILAAGLIAMTVAAAEFPVALAPNGALRIDGNLFQVICYDASWHGFAQESGAFRVRNSSGSAADFKLEGEFRIGSASGILQQSLRQTDDGSARYHADIRFSSPVKLSTLALTASLPVKDFCGREIIVNDKQKLVLPIDYKPGATHAVYRADVTGFQLPGQTGKLTFRGNFEFSIQDDRAFNGSTYTLRILFTPPRGEISTASLGLEIQAVPYRTAPLDLSGAVNAGFADETDGDRKGGWTDQGAANDLRMLKPGRINLNGIEFDILDPAGNGGNSCIMLAGPARSYFALRAEAKQPKPLQGSYLYLLHALAWPAPRSEIGKVTVNYADGSNSSFPVTSHVDVGNWWAPSGLENGEVAWTAENRSAYVGLYRSTHPIEDKPIRSVVFDSANRSIWGVVAASVGDDPVPLRRSTPFYIVENAEWKPVVFHKDVEKGSVLDFSGKLDAPAGKYGPVVNRNGKFVFRDRPEIPVRFYGTNFCGTAQFLPKEWAEKLADRMAAAGYNAIRFHHQDGALSRKDQAEKRSTDLHKERLDQLDYLMHCMAKRGIYYTTDLYVSRSLAKGELPEFPDREIRQQEFKALVFVLDSAMANWKAFARNWLTHVNPYTGYALKDDPALISLSLINENVPNTCWNSEPDIAELYLKKFETWKKENPQVANDPALSHEQQFSLFLTDNYERGYREMRDFLRDEIGVDKMLTDMNHQPQVILQFSRNLYDYVDNHFYHDHPNFPVNPWRLPSTLSNNSALGRAANPPSRMFATRIYGKPMMISEFDYAKPNVFRAEGPALAGAYAALQDWDALFHFAYSHNRNGVTDQAAGGHFDTFDDVVKALSQRIGIRLFLGGEVKAAPVAFAIPLATPRGLRVTEEFSPQILELGLIARTGSVIVPDGKPGPLPNDLKGFVTLGRNSPQSLPGGPGFDGRRENRELLKQMTAAGALKPEWHDAERGIYRSSSGQISLDSRKQTFQVVSAGCEAFVLPEKLAAEGEFLKVENRIGRGVFAIMSVDGRPLAEASRLLLLHLTDSQRNKVKFSGEAMTQLESWGELPHLARRGEAEIMLKTPGNYKLYPVDTAGKRLTEIPLTRDGNSLRFPAKVFTPDGPVFAYELVRQ